MDSKRHDNSLIQTSIMATNPNKKNTNKQSFDCLISKYHIEQNESNFAIFACRIRAFGDKFFKAWRCPNCLTIHILDVVDIDFYYPRYLLTQATLTWLYRILYRKLRQQLTKHWFSKSHSMLNYGCGVQRLLFLQYLWQQEFANCYGYDLYALKGCFAIPKVFNKDFLITFCFKM